MKRRMLAVAVLVAAGVGGGLTGCGKPEGSGTGAAAEVKGEPIVRGEPIAAPSTGGVAVAVAAAGAPTGAVASAASTSPAAGAAAAATPAAPAVAVAGGGTAASPLTVGFDRLASFQYALPDGPVDTNTVVTGTASAQIPGTIQALNNQYISLKGFMLPLKVEKGLVTELLIMRDQSMCCYGTVPRINEWVSVKMVGSGVKPVMDQAVTLFGRLKVGEMYENGYLVGIYAMDAERMAGPLDM